MKLLADTSALLALVMRDDRNHGPAASFVRQNPRAHFVLTDLILAEVVTRVRARADAHLAVTVARNLLGSRRYQVVFVDRDLLEGAISRMAQYGDKRLSLADCASLETMARLGLAAAFTFDLDFRGCGFEMRP